MALFSLIGCLLRVAFHRQVLEMGKVMYQSDIGKLKQYIEKIENLEVEKTEIQEHISDIYKQAKSDGFDARIMKKVIKLKKMKTEDRETEDMLLDTYMLALGLIPPSDEKVEGAI